MKKYFWIAALLAVSYLPAFTQNPEKRKIDSLRIDSLKKVLPSLRDTARINCLILLFDKTQDFMSNLKMKADSCYPYAIQANKEAKEIGYKYGLAKSFIRLGTVENIRDYLNISLQSNDSSHLKAMKQYIWEAVLLAEELKDDGLLANAYYDWGETFFKQNNLHDGVEGYKKALYYYRKIGDEQTEGEICTWLCIRYSEMGKYEEGFEYCERSLKLNQKLQKNTSSTLSLGYRNYLIQQSLVNMADLYKVAGDYETAMNYLRQSRLFAVTHNTNWKMDAEMGELFRLMGQYDSSFYYLKKSTARDPKRYSYRIKLGETYMATKEYDKALYLFQGIIDSCRAMKNKTRIRSELGESLINAAKIYLEKKNYKIALRYIKEGISLVEYRSYFEIPLINVMEGYEPLSKIYHQMGRNDSAYFYLLKYANLKDSILNKQFIWRLNNYKQAAEDTKKEARIGLLNKDNKIKDQQLKQEVQLKKFLIFGLIGLLLIAIFIFRNLTLKRKNSKLQVERLEQEMKMQQLVNDKRHTELRQQATELEMQALRAQMNPHFIFNCLSSINKFILKNESRAASDYLTRFSRLIRMVLTNSQLSMIPLSDEIEMLRLYLDMERLRFSNSFNYNIVYANAIEPETIYIPPMILQPFCENAIWHGLMHKEGQGRLDIVMSIQNNQLQCTIADNGIGRTKAAELKSKSGEKQKSFGLKITTERLALFNNEKTVRTFYNSEDVLDTDGNIAGTEVTLHIKYKNEIHEPVS